MNYYNENDPFVANWLRNLIAANLIPPGTVDERSILDVKPSELSTYAQCHFFAGTGGWSRALQIAAWPVDRPVWTGSCPCQPFSTAGKRRGFADDRHLWPYWRYVIAQCRPAIIFGEQVASASAWLGLVRGDLEALDYAVGAVPIEAASAGADHLRDRYWFVADDAASGEGRGRVQRPGESLPAAGERAPSQLAGSSFDGGFVAQSDRAIISQQRPVESRLQNGHSNSGVMEHAASDGRSEGRPEHELRSGRNPTAEPSGSIFMADADFGGNENGMRLPLGGREGLSDVARSLGGEFDAGRYEWVLGADGKARRVEPGVRLLVDGFPNRVGLLRGFGNAIDPRPAAAFIRSYMECS